MDAQVYHASLKGSWKKLLNSSSNPNWHDQVTPMQNTVLHVHVGKPLNEGNVDMGFIRNVLDYEGTMCSLLWRENAHGEIPVHLAARFGHVKAVREFLRRVKRVDLEDVRRMLRKTNTRKDTAMHEAARGGYDEVVKVLVEADSSCSYEANDANETPLYLAVESGCCDCVDVMLDFCGPYVWDCKGPCGRTALHAAVRWATPETMRKITGKHGSIVSIQDDEGLTPLHHAAMLDKASTLGTLLKCESTAAYIRDKEGRTALHIAALHRNTDAMKQIIAYRPDCVEIVDNKGQNALHYVANWACIHKFEYVLGLGHLDKLMSDKDVNGNTPFHLVAASVQTCFCMIRLRHRITPKKRYVHLFNDQNLTAGDILASHEIKYAWDYMKKLAPIGGRIVTHPKLKDTRAGTDDMNKNRDSHVKEVINSHIVVAALVATITFAAGLAVPGGFNQNTGIALLLKKTTFQRFLRMDTGALIFSVAAIICYFYLATWAKHSKSPSYIVCLGLADSFCISSVLYMLVAFFFGVNSMTLGKVFSPPTSIVECVLELLFISYLVELLFMCLFTYIIVVRYRRSYSSTVRLYS